MQEEALADCLADDEALFGLRASNKDCSIAGARLSFHRREGESPSHPLPHPMAPRCGPEAVRVGAPLIGTV